MTKKRHKTVKKTKQRARRSKKVQYRVSNWKNYNDSLVQRGDVTLWISEEVLAGWKPQPEGKRGRGGQRQYSAQIIECLLTVRTVFHLPYRQTEGFARSLIRLLKLAVKVPDYSTLCKRSADLSVELPYRQSHESMHIVVDSSGLKVYGEGEWKVRQHGYSQRRTWRKVHLSVDATTHIVQAVVLTEASVHDADASVQLLAQTVGEIDQISGDGTYDKRKFYDACTQHGVSHIAVPPARNARIWQHGNSSQPPLPRDQNLRHIRRVGRKRWKREVGYHRRSLAETAVFRFKTIFGDTLSTRTLARQVVEVRLKTAALNRMTHLGMPETYRVA